MTDFGLLDLDPPKPGSSKGRKPSAISSWEDNVVGKKENVPVHLFASPSHSDSALSSSTNSSRPRERRRRKKSVQETAFSSLKIGHEKKREKALIHSPKAVEEILSSPSNSHGYTSSGTEDFSSPGRKPRKKSDTFTKPLPPLRTNKIHDVRAQDEIRRIRIDEENELKNRSKITKLKKNREEAKRPPSNSPIEGEAGRSFTPMSDNMSYREKIRDRFNTVKERAVESLSRPQSRSQSRLKLLMMKQPGTRMEDLLKKEEDEVTAAIERHEKTKLRWKEIYKEVLHVEHATHEEGYFFFTDANEVTSRAATPLADLPGSPSTVNSPLETQADAKMLTSDYLGIKDDWDLVEFVKPENTDDRAQTLKEKELIFCPSTSSVSIEDKLEPGLNPRYLEEEGLYTGNKMKVPRRMRNKMEQRILMAPDGRKWFGEDGELLSSPSPLKLYSTRPFIDEDSAPASSKIVFKPAILGDLKHRYVDLSGDLNYVLDLDISFIQFSHHPLFSREHLVAQRLKELFIKYKRRTEVDHLSRLCGRLDALRRARDNLKSVINESGDNENLRKQLHKYEEDIKEVRNLRNFEGQIDKQLLNKILITWKDLKQLREQQGYQNTTLKLNIKKKVTEDSGPEKKKWESEIKNDVQEIQEEREKEYMRVLNEFKVNRENWLRNRKKKLRIEESEDSADILSDTESMANSDSEQEDEAEDELKQPEKPDTSEIRSQVMETYKNSFRQPGEPEIEISMSTTVNPDVTAYNNKEEQRRAAVKRNQVYIKLFYNGKEVCRSKSQPLSQKFRVVISQRFTIRILEWPESLMIEIHEDTGPLTKNLLVSGIYLPFPDGFTTVQNSEAEEHEFSSNITVSYTHSGVGSGYSVSPYPEGSEFNNRPVCLFTSGIISCRLGWAEDGGKILAPPEVLWKNIKEDATASLFQVIGTSGKFDVSKLKDWAEKSKLDPNDPYNSAFFHFLEQAGDSVKVDPSYFRLDPLQRDFNFCEEADIDKNFRLKLLKLRDLGEPEFRGMKPVPLNEKQIHKDIFKIYEKRISTPYRLLDIVSSDPLDGHRAWGKKYLEQVQQRVLKQCRLARQHKRFQDIISEETVPDIGTLGLTFMKWLQPKRPLRPVRKERKKITVQNLSGQDVKIVVNVVRAFEVPVRKDVDTMSVNGSIEGFSLVNVRPFVEVSFRGIKARTTAAEGANPTWNQDLQIPLHTKNGDFSPGSLQSIKDTLYLHLFDEMVVDLIEDENLRETNIHQRLERHWLAGMEIPFSTLYFNSRIEGTFKLYSPSVLLGYEREAHRRQFGGATQEPLLPQRDATYITLFVTVQPALNPPEPFKEKLESSEVSSLEKHLEGWQQEVASLFPHRKIKTLVIDITGKSVCVTRFVKPLPPPEVIENEKTTPEMAARFVSMIPSIAGSTFFPGLFDIWLTSDQILRLLTGDSEDHALLLCSYFLHLGLKAYVLLGSGIPHGSTAYVFVKEGFSKNSEYYIWDPTNGQKYNINDSFCPLQKIYCLIDDQNIWANIQPEEAPRRTRFDLSKRADWFPAFGRNIAAPTGSVQPQTLDYRVTSKQSVDILQDKMEKRLRDSLMKWRKKNRTQWNRYCAAILRKLLPKLEEATWNAGDNHSPNHILELHHILASHKMCGFPINMAYTDMEAVTEAVKATGVHCNETDGVEFAVAVYIHPYPNDVLSVWIYVASLVKRR